MRARQIIVKEDLSMDTRVMETDHEVQMARADLFKLAKYSVELHKLLKNVSEEQGLDYRVVMLELVCRRYRDALWSPTACTRGFFCK